MNWIIFIFCILNLIGVGALYRLFKTSISTRDTLIALLEKENRELQKELMSLKVEFDKNN